MDDQSKNHAKFLILYHLIFVCKYRKKHFWKERTFWSDGYFCCTIGKKTICREKRKRRCSLIIARCEKKFWPPRYTCLQNMATTQPLCVILHAWRGFKLRASTTTMLASRRCW